MFTFDQVAWITEEGWSKTPKSWKHRMFALPSWDQQKKKLSLCTGRSVRLQVSIYKIERSMRLVEREKGRFFFHSIRWLCVRSTRESAEIYTLVTSIQRRLAERATFRLFARCRSLHDTGLCVVFYCACICGPLGQHFGEHCCIVCKLQNRTMFPG